MDSEGRRAPFPALDRTDEPHQGPSVGGKQSTLTRAVESDVVRAVCIGILSGGSLSILPGVFDSRSHSLFGSLLALTSLASLGVLLPSQLEPQGVHLAYTESRRGLSVGSMLVAMGAVVVLGTAARSS